MAYGLRIRFEFNDDQDSYYAVNLLQRDYSGSADVRELTGQPAIIEYGDNSADEFPIVLGSMASINFYAEDGDDWGMLYTADRRKFRLDIRKDNAITGPIVFTGWLMTQEYSERLTWQPTLSIKAICGLGELKELDYIDTNGDNFIGRVSYLKLITDLLARLDLNLSIHTAIDWRDSNMTEGDAFAQEFVDLSIYAGMDCRKVIDQVLFGCRIMQRSGAWYIESYTALKRSFHTQYNYDSTGVLLPVPSEVITPLVQINQQELWIEGTPTLERWPAYDKLVVEQNYCKKPSFLNNYNIDGLNGWTVPSSVKVYDHVVENETYKYLSGTDASGVTTGIYQVVPIRKFATDKKFKFSVQVAPIGWHKVSSTAVRGIPVTPLSVKVRIQVVLMNASQVDIAWLSKDGWVETVAFIDEADVQSTVSGPLSFHNIEVETEYPSIFGEGEDFYIRVLLAKAPDQFIAQPQTPWGLFIGLVYSEVVITEGGDFSTGQTITGINTNRYLDKKDDLKLLAGTVPENVNSSLIWAGGLTNSTDGNDRADAWKMDGGTVTYGFCELMARMVMSLRRIPVTIMKANAVGVNIGAIYNELNQPGVDYVFTGGTLDLQTRTLEGQWVELLAYSPDFAISTGIRAVTSGGSVYRSSGNNETRVFSSEGLPKRVTELNHDTEVSNDMSFEVDRTDFADSKQVTVSQVIAHTVNEIIENDLLAGYVGSGSNGIPDIRTILLDGAVMWLIGMIIQSTKLVYLIIGEKFQISKQTKTLADADPTYPRIDVVCVDTSSELLIFTGTPGAIPVAPQVPESALYITQFYIPASATQPDVDVDIVYDENTVGEWTASGATDAGITLNFDATTAPVGGTKHIEVALAIPDTAVATPTHYIGEIMKTDGVPYGKIFYIANGGKKGLIAPDFATSPGGGVFYERLTGGEPYTTGANNKDIGGGPTNTAKLMAHHLASDAAAKYAANYRGGGFTDWFLGALREVEQLAFRKSLFPFLNGWSWTSTEVDGVYDWKRAFIINFDNGATYIRDKNINAGVVPIRAFDDNLDVPGVPVEVYTPINTLLNFVAPMPVEMNNGIVSFCMKTSAEWLIGTELVIKLYNDNALVGRIVISNRSGMRGFNPADQEWQLIGIQASQFAMTETTVNRVVFTLINSWPNPLVISIDQIRIQYDSHQVPEDLITPGSYGEATKGLVITYNAQGKAIKVEEIDNVPADETVTAAKLAPDMVTTLAELAVDKVDPVPATTNGYSGTVIKLTAAVNLAFGDLCFINAAGKAALASAATEATATGVVLCVEPTLAANTEGVFLLYGIARKDTWNWTVGGGSGLIYLSIIGTSGNTLAQTVVSAEDQVSQILGFATHATRIFFNPSLIQTVYKA